jgi:hypothetical protein
MVHATMLPHKLRTMATCQLRTMATCHQQHATYAPTDPHVNTPPHQNVQPPATHLQQVHQWWQDVGVDHALDLLLGARGDVGDGPAGLLLDGLLVVGRQQRQQAAQRAAVDHHLRARKVQKKSNRSEMVIH